MAKLFAAPAVSSLRVSTFKGLDVSMPDDQIALYRAADSLNMIPDASGEVRKRPGIKLEENQADFEIKGIPEGTTPRNIIELYPKRLVITKDYKVPSGWDPVFSGYSVAVWIGDEWKLVDNLKEKPVVVKVKERYFVFGQGEIIVADVEGYVTYDSGGFYSRYKNGSLKSGYIQYNDSYLTLPTINIGCNAGGGGTPHQQINLMNPWVTESFCITNEYGENTFYLNDKPDISAEDDRIGGDKLGKAFYVEVLTPVTEEDTETGEKIERLVWLKRDFNEKDGYRQSANRIFLSPDGTDKRAKITDSENPGCGNIIQSPKQGEDNVRITYKRKNFKEGFLSLCNCLCGTVYGVGGYKDRLFLGGAENTIYYSELEDPFYFGALNYVHTEDGSKVMALDGTGGKLSVITDKGIVFLSGQTGTSDEDSYVFDATFVVSNTIPAPVPIGYNNTAIFGGEIVYLSKEGVIAIAAKDNYDERYAECRSALINRRMLADQPQKILNYGRYLLVFCEGGYCWILDENQPSSAGDRPYSSHQYEGFRMDGFKFNPVYIEDGILKMIGWGNKIYYWTAGCDAIDYADEYEDGYGAKRKVINAFWETPWIYGSNFYRKKRFSRLALLLGEADLGDYQIKVEGKKNDETDWSTVWDYDGTFCTFDYSRVNYGLFTYRTTHACPDLVRKIKIKKALRFKLRFSNDKINQSFVLREFGLDYVLGG